MTGPSQFLMSHPTQNQNVKQAALALAEAGMLGALHTTINTSALPRVATRAFPRVAGRSLPAVVGRLTVSHPWLEALRLAGASRLLRGRIPTPSIDTVYQHLDVAAARALSKGHFHAYCYEDGARRTFESAQEIPEAARVYDLPIGYWRAHKRIISAEADRWPEWKPTLTALRDSPAKLANKDAELSLATLVVVASSFTRRTLEEFEGRIPPIVVIPYGTPSPQSQIPEKADRGKLRVLYAGSLTQRKGLADLLEAVEPLGRFIELTLVGDGPVETTPVLAAAVSRHTWKRHLAHGDLLREMRRQDVLALPSHFEGFGLVISEALSQGLAVVATHHTAAPDLFLDGQAGFILDPGDVDGLTESFERLLRSLELLRAMQAEALSVASLWPWERYRANLIRCMSGALAA